MDWTPNLEAYEEVSAGMQAAIQLVSSETSTTCSVRVMVIHQYFPLMLSEAHMSTGAVSVNNTQQSHPKKKKKKLLKADKENLIENIICNLL